MIRIETCTSRELLTDLPGLDLEGARIAMVHADPPWRYGGAAPPKHGRATASNDKVPAHYSGMSMPDIVDDLALAARVVPGPCYLATWCTYPTIWDFAQAWWSNGGTEGSHVHDWKQLTGGTWGKVGRRGIGFHMRGDSEPVLVFRKGKPPRGEQCSNLWQSDVELPSAEPYWPEKKTAHHSEKPPAALADLVKVCTKPGDVVVDLYAGASASLARVCHLLGRSYVGAEADPDRAERARGLLSAIV